MTKATKTALALFLTVLIILGCSPGKSSPTTVAFPTGTFINGDWSWEFKADGTFLTSGPIGSETGTYTVSGNQVIITCQCCGEVEGTYTWAFDDNALSFAVMDDTCANRNDVVDGSSWLKQP